MVDFCFIFFLFFLVVIECTLFAPFTWTFRSVSIPDMKPKIWHDPLKKKSFASSGCNKMSFAVTWSRGNRILNWSVPLIRGESYKIDWYLLPTYFELFGTLGYRRATALHWDSQSVHHHHLLHTVLLTQFLQVVFGSTLFHGDLRNVINSFLFCTLVPTMAASVCDQWLQPLRKKIKHSKLRWAYSIAHTSSLTVLFVIQQ